MSLKLFSCPGGTLMLPTRTLVLTSRQDGGNLVVNPPRDVWERSELTPGELTYWSFLVAATGKAMLNTLPQLAGGCINYWEAGNWALNELAEPRGRKIASEYRRVHLHLLGRNPRTSNPDWRWGEAPKFPDFVERHAWAATNERLTAAECQQIVTQVEALLTSRYEMPASSITPWFTCPACSYPTTGTNNQTVCEECQQSL